MLPPQRNLVSLNEQKISSLNFSMSFKFFIQKTTMCIVFCIRETKLNKETNNKLLSAAAAEFGRENRSTSFDIS